MDLAQLEAFQEVVHYGSFRRGAKALFLSHPALIQRIRRLESELGEILFERQGNRIHLTQAGRALVPHVAQVLEIERQGREAVLAVVPPSETSLIVGATPTVATYFLPDALMRWRTETAGEAQVMSRRTAGVLSMVLRQEVHLGLLRATTARAMALSHPEVEPVFLYSEKVVLVASPSHPMAFSGQVSISQVVREPIFLYRGESFYRLIEQECREQGVVARVHMHLDGPEGTKRMVERGLGVSFIPWSAIREEISDGSLTHVPLLEGCEPRIDVLAMVKRGVPLGAPACALLNVLIDEGSRLEAGGP